MPLYSYKLADGSVVEEFQHMSAAPLTEIAGQKAERTVQKPKVRTQYGEGSNTKPIEMLSIALDNEDEIDEFRQRNPGTEISRDRRSASFGVPIAKSRTEKLRMLKNEGFVETN